MHKNKGIVVNSLEDLEDQLHVMAGIVESLKKNPISKSETEVVSYI